DSGLFITMGEPAGAGQSEPVSNHMRNESIDRNRWYPWSGKSSRVASTPRLHTAISHSHVVTHPFRHSLSQGTPSMNVTSTHSQKRISRCRTILNATRPRPNRVV